MKRIISLTLAFLMTLGVTFQLFPKAKAAEENIFDTYGWKVGAYDATQNTSSARRHCVIPLSVGEKYSFSIPQRTEGDYQWLVYVTLADAQGAIYIGAPRFRVYDGDVYTVRPLDSVLGNRTPTEMRITIMPDPDRHITEEMMQDLSLGLYRTYDANNAFNTATWNKGSVANPNAASRRNCTIPVSWGDVIRFQRPDSGWRFNYLLYSGDEKLAEFGDSQATYTVKEINGKIPDKMVVVMRPDPDANIDNIMWTLMEAGCYITRLEDMDNMLDAIEWKVGAYYTTPNTATSRRHCIIPLTVGDKYTFSIPDNNWVVFVTLADADGAIYITSSTASEFQVSNGDAYTVRLFGAWLSNRTPTEMRITIRPNPDANITDAMMENLNIGLKKTVEKDNLFNTAAWKNGSYTAPGAASRKHCEIPCSLGDVLKFRFDDSKWHLQFQLADEEGTILNRERYLSFNTPITVSQINGRTPTKVIVNMVPNPDANITNKMWALMNVSLTRTAGSLPAAGKTHPSDSFRFATMNVGIWNMGVAPRGVADDQAASKSAAWQQHLADVNADIFCGQEYYPYFNRSANVLAAEAVLDQYSVVYEDPFLYGKVTASNIALTGYSTSSYAASSGRGYTKLYADINGTQVCIINIHTNFGTFETSTRKAEFEELLAIMQQEEFVIVCGDFNVDSPDEFQFFTSSGYRAVNCGKFGNMPTCGALCIDNILVSSNIEILSAQVVDSGLSDHRLLYADLQLVTNGIVAVDGQGSQTKVEDPLAAWETGNYTHLKLLSDTDLGELSGQTVCVDLNGNDLTVAGNGTLNAFDTANDTYIVASCGHITNNGSVKVSPVITAPNGNHYVAITDGTTTMHRYHAPVKTVSLRTSAAGLYYKATYYCDEVLSAKVKNYGVVLSVHDMPGSDFITDIGSNNCYTVIRTGFESGAVATSGSVFGIMKSERAAGLNAKFGEMKIYANAYIEFDLDDLTVVGDTQNTGKTVEDEAFSGTAWSLRDVMQALDKTYDSYEQADQTRVDAFYTEWKNNGMNHWNFQKIGKQTAR